MTDQKPADQRIGSIAPFGLRMLPDLRDRIEAAAKKAGRSMNAEIVWRLESTLNETEPFSVKMEELRNVTDRATEVLKQVYEYETGKAYDPDDVSYPKITPR